MKKNLTLTALALVALCVIPSAHAKWPKGSHRSGGKGKPPTTETSSRQRASGHTHKPPALFA